MKVPFASFRGLWECELLLPYPIMMCTLVAPTKMFRAAMPVVALMVLVLAFKKLPLDINSPNVKVGSIVPTAQAFVGSSPRGITGIDIFDTALFATIAQIYTNVTSVTTWCFPFIDIWIVGTTAVQVDPGARRNRG